MDWSPLQQAVFDDVSKGDGNTVVRARAGTGKSTTAFEAVGRCPDGSSVIFVAFNKSIADHAKPRLPHARVGTAHALGAAAMHRGFPGTTLEKQKSRILLDDSGFSRQRITQLGKAVSLAKGCLANTEEAMGHVVKRFRIAYDAPMWANQGAAQQGGAEPKDKAELFGLFVTDALSLLKRHGDTTAIHDFDDMIWLPLKHNLFVARCDNLFIDETQDFNAGQLALARKCAPNGARIIAIGDDRQAIYGFRGADRNAVQYIIDRLSAKVLPLSITYRCGKAIVDSVKFIVPDYEAGPMNGDGIVDEAEWDEMIEGAAPGDFILSRTNAPVMKACIRLLKRGKPATIAGRDIGENLVFTIESSNCKSITSFAKWLGNWRTKEIARIIAIDPEADLTNINDTYECLDALMEGVDTVSGLIARLRSLFTNTDDTQRIVCSSTHKAKGLERDRVWLLRETYLRRNDVEEQNLFYVACTRAKSHLTMVYEQDGPREGKEDD